MSRGAAAIVGIGCRFPGGADSPERFWALLRDGIDAIGEVPPERFDLDRFFNADPAHEGTTYSRFGGFVDGVDRFDAAFFGFSPREASRIDPQHRLLLEVAHEAFEDAGQPLDRLAGSRTGVFVGLSTRDYADLQMYPENRPLIDAHSNSGGAGSIAANRISYVFDLRGPSVVLDTACSSSLTAAHFALQSLRSGDCDAALVGGAMLILEPGPTIGFSKAQMLAADGRCRAFSAAASGYVRSDGVGAVLLRPLEAALADGDRIYAVLRGTAVNQDGRTKGMTVPSAAAQEAMLRAGLEDAGVEAAAVQYVEAHGTGTPVGDPLEAAALGAVFGAPRNGGDPCPIGSVKTNVGHSEAAAGMAGLIKAALALDRGRLPPSLHFDEPNPEIDFAGLGLRVVTELEPWPAADGPRRAAVNSFGFGGANANAVLEQAPDAAPVAAPDHDEPRLLAISARSPEALASLARSYAELLSREDPPSLATVANAAAHRRTHHDHRLAVVASNGAKAAALLDQGAVTGHRSTQKLAFVYSGMGPQWWRMGRELHASEPVFRAALERCEVALAAVGCWPVLETLLADEAGSRMAEPDVAQVANFALQVALTELLAARGIVPEAVVGHSAGEMAAAYAAGALTLDEAALVTFHRSRLQATTAGTGTMLAAAIDRAEAEQLIAPFGGAVTLGAINAPASLTLSGDAEILAQVERQLAGRGVFARLLQVVVPYHSSAMDPILGELADSLATLASREPRVPLVSSVTGAFVAQGDLDAAYWCREVREPVRFLDAVDALADAGCTAFLEVGPHPALGSAIGECLQARGATGTVVHTLRRKEDARASFLQALGALYIAGVSPHWETVHPGAVEHVSLPTYPWQRERHWLESGATADAPLASDPDEHPLLGRRVRAAKPLWEASLAEPRLGWLDDHVVQGTVPFPGVGYVEMGLAVSRRLLGHAAPGVRDVEFRHALFLGEGRGALVQLAVDPDSRRFEVHGAPAGAQPEWTLHTAGTLTGGKPSHRSVDLDDLRSRCGPELEHDEVYRRLAGWGFEYGPAFAGLEWAAATDGQAIGEVALELDVERYEVHPGLFDAALQLLILAAETAGGALPRRGFLPVRAGEVSVNQPPGARFLAHARITRAGDIAGDVDILAPDGSVLVEVRGMECRFLEELGGAVETTDDLLYSLEWEAAPLADASPLAPPDRQALEALAAGSGPLARELDWAAYYDEVEPVLDRAAAGYAAAALRELGDLQVDPRRAPLHNALRALVAAVEPDPTPDALLALLVDEHPAYALDAALLARCGGEIAAVLRGDGDAAEFLFSPDAIDLLHRFYRDAPTASFYNTLLADAVATIANGGTRPVRVLEVGGGTGGTTSHLLSRLESQVDYHFTDISSFFTAHAADEFAGHASFASSVLDLERDPAEQGFAPGSFDVVVAANVLHATAEVEPTLQRVRDLVAPGGALVLLEITRRGRWLDAVFGLTDGWWAFTDRELRDHPLLPAEQWRALLERHGLEDVAVLHDAPADGAPGQSVLVARAPASSSGKRWRVRGGGVVGERVAARLAQAGALGDGGIVDLTALDVECPDDASGEELLELEVALCGDFADLLRTLDATELVLVTAGVHDVSGEDAPEPLQAGVWGLGRTLAKERPELASRLVDLSTSPSDAELDLLVAELLASETESEVALRERRRLVPRLQRLETGHRDAPARRAEPGDRFRAQVQTPGLLDSVRLIEVEEPPLGPGEVEVAVAAAGLNFRDVMLALDLLPPLALQELQGTDRLGLESAGTVLEVGSEVKGIAPGDEVMVAMGYGSFGSHVRAAAALVVPKPASIGFEAAAGIPVAFGTAYLAFVRLARVRAGERVLIHAATGAVGLAAIEVARDLGAELYATAGSPEKREYLRSIGIEHVFDSRSLGFAAEVLERTGGRGVDVVLNSLGGEAIAKGISVLAPSGRFVEIGKRDIYEDRHLGLLDFRKNLSYFALDVDRLVAEQPELVGEIFRAAVGKIESGVYRLPPLEVFPLGEAPKALQKVAQARHIGKVVLAVAGEELEIVPRRDGERGFRGDGTYLVTGGLGGFGLALSAWLAERGAGTLVLVGRSGAQPEVEAALAAIRASGAHVEVIAADVSRWEEVERVLERVRAELPPLRGVFHAAMAMDDAPLAQLDEARLRNGLAAKVAGGWNLHRATLGDKLDAFVLFSSIVGVFGNGAQAGYAAGNAFLDALSHRRRAQGLPSLSVNWGPISDVGFVARKEGLGSFLAGQGYIGMEAGEALEALDRLLATGLPQAMAARIDFVGAPPVDASSPRVRHLVPQGAIAGGGPRRVEGSDLAELLGAPSAQAGELALEHVRARIQRVLGTDGATIDTARPLTELGLDSLMAVELLASLKAGFGVEIPAVRLLQGATLAELAGLLLAGLDLESEQAPTPIVRVAMPAELPAGNGNGAAPTAPPADTNGVEPVDANPSQLYSTLDHAGWDRRQRIARRSISGFVRAAARVRAEGLEHLPKSGGVVLAVNHLSMADLPVMFSVLERPAIPFAAEELRRYPWLRLVLSDVGNAIYVRRGERDEQAIAQALAVLRAGGVLAVMPEGRRSATGALERGKAGAAYLAALADVPVIPVVAWGQERLGRDLVRLRRARVEVRFGPPLRFPTGEPTARELRDRTDRIMLGLARLLPQSYRGVYAVAADRTEEGA